MVRSAQSKLNPSRWSSLWAVTLMPMSLQSMVQSTVVPVDAGKLANSDASVLPATLDPQTPATGQTTGQSNLVPASPDAASGTPGASVQNLEINIAPLIQAAFHPDATPASAHFTTLYQNAFSSPVGDPYAVSPYGAQSSPFISTSLDQKYQEYMARLAHPFDPFSAASAAI